ncbi:MAG: hypothetical protein U0R50_03835 [Gaiellales bacterium]
MSTETQSRPLSELLLAGVGWAAQGLEAADQLADELAKRVGVETGEMRAAMRDTLAKWRDEAGKLGTRTDDTFERVVGKAGLVRRDEIDELELRVAQLEHRVKLLEG